MFLQVLSGIQFEYRGYAIRETLLTTWIYLNSTLNFGIPPALVFQLENYYKAVRLLTGLTAQQKGTTVRWYSNKTSLLFFHILVYLYTL